MDLEKIKGKILFKLARRRKWGESHTPINLALKGFKKNEIDKVKNALDELIKINWIIVKPTSSGKHISLNPNFSKEIKYEIEKLFGFKI